MTRSIPAVWRIDVEPDDHQAGESTRWTGFAAQIAAVDALRPRLSDCSGFPVHPTWMFRLDPDIERGFGRVDYVLEHHGALVDGLRRHGDPLGIHVHAYRWDAERGVTYTDTADPAWPRHCLAVAAETFAARLGEPARRSSMGGYYLGEDVVDEAVRLGIEVDVTAEPGKPPRAADPSFGVYATAPSTDFTRFPRRPYYPSRRDAATPATAAADARPILLVPLSAYDFSRALAPLRRRIADRLRRRPRRHQPLNPWRDWPSPRVYWDLVARAVDEQAVSYAAFAIRSDAPESALGRHTLALVQGLVGHPISKRLRFVDPLDPEIRRLAEVPVGGPHASPRTVRP